MIGLSGVFHQVWYSPFRLCKRQIFLLSDVHYILRRRVVCGVLFVNNVFESFKNVNLYKETVIIITQCNVLITNCVLLCSLIYPVQE